MDQAVSNSRMPEPANLEGDHLIRAVIAAQNSWSEAFRRVIQARHDP